MRMGAAAGSGPRRERRRRDFRAAAPTAAAAPGGRQVLLGIGYVACTMRNLRAVVSPALAALLTAGASFAQEPVAVAAKKPEPEQVTLLRPPSFADLAEVGFDPTSLLTGVAAAKPKPFFALLDMILDLTVQPGENVLLDLSAGFGLNLAQQREVERAIAQVHKAGKHITCYLENAGVGAYQIAAQCDPRAARGHGQRRPALVGDERDALQGRPRPRRRAGRGDPRRRV